MLLVNGIARTFQKKILGIGMTVIETDMHLQEEC
jgi:hypothetical protein